MLEILVKTIYVFSLFHTEDTTVNM